MATMAAPAKQQPKPKLINVDFDDGYGASSFLGIPVERLLPFATIRLEWMVRWMGQIGKSG